MYPEDNGRIFDEYFSSSFKQVNILTKEQYEKASDNFELSYGKFLPKNKNATILDVGCGTGHFLYYLKNKGYKNFLGIDISPQQIEFCKKNISEKVKLANGLEFLKDKDKIYDVVAAHDLLEHIPKDKILFFVNVVHNSLKKKGIFIVRVPNMSNPFSLDTRYSDFTHEIGFTAKSLYQVLWSGGFRDIRILPPKIISVHSFRNFVRRILVNILHKFIRFLYYIQDFTVPQNLDKNLVIISRKK